MKRKPESGQIIPFFIFIIMALGLMTAVSLQIGRIVYARGEVGKAADAAALAAAARLDVITYRETGSLVFLPDAAALAAAARLDVITYRETGSLVFLPDAAATAQDYASRNASFLASRGIGVTVNQIWLDAGSQTVFVSVSADLASLLPGFLEHRGVYTVTGFARARMQGTP